jgi:FixJ family two-component response regulator
VSSVGLRVELFTSAQEFLRSKRPDVPSCLVLDMRLPGLSGLDLQRRTSDGEDGSRFSTRVGQDG